MSHFYKYNKGNPVFLEDVATPAQAKKVQGAWPSVTTVLGIIKDPFLDSIYKPMKITELAREMPSMHWRGIADLTYGTRESPVTGEQIPSSEFGTAVHKRIEEFVLADMDARLPADKTPWDGWARPFIDWYIDNDVTPVAVEHMLGEGTVKIVGSVDFIGKDASGEAFLADYKCRANCKGTGKFYPKDLYQLAIESWMLSKRAKMDYIPGCISICIDCETKKHYHKVWNPEQILEGIEIAKLCSKLYWRTRM
mgnify:FL=1